MSQRADQAMVARGLCATRSRAAQMIKAGQVGLNGRLVKKASSKVLDTDELTIMASGPQFASRAGLKLYGALLSFPDIAIHDRRCLDAGASTGGFTDVLLQAGAAQVCAVDVGHGQIIDRLREDPRVDVYEGLNVRHMTPEDIGGVVDVVVSDLSFISLRLVMRRLVEVARQDADLVLMVKPQFEVGKQTLPKSGVVTDPGQRRRAVTDVVESAVEAGLFPQALGVSAVPGQEGNKEFFLWATKTHTEMVQDVTSWVVGQDVEWADK